MAANVTPIFPKVGQVGWATLAAANTAADGTGATSAIFTAGVDGARVDFVRLLPLGTNVASVLRVYVNNGAASSTAANNTLLAEVALPATTLSQLSGQPAVVVPVELALPAGYTVRVALATAVAAGWQVTAVGGNY